MNQAWAVGSAGALGVQRTEVASSPPARDPIGDLIGSYRIVRALGKGGCGSVWLAEHEVIGSKVAIKILSPEVVNIPGVQERFITEARAASTIPSSHVARYTDLGQLSTGEPYAIMEYLEGETVHARISRERRLAIVDALTITRQAAETLALAHGASIIHRDIKPENIFLVGPVGDAHINIKVLDFGIAKLIGDALQSAHLTAAGSFIGTPAYCAPEQLCGSATSTAVDMYALGTTLFEMLTGTLPFDTSTPEFVVTKVTEAAPRVRSRRPEIPPRLDALVAAMLAANPNERPATMGDLLAELGRVDEPLAPVAIERRSRRPVHRAVIFGGVVVAIAALVFALLTAGGNSSPESAVAVPQTAPAAAPSPTPITVTPIAPTAAEPPPPVAPAIEPPLAATSQPAVAPLAPKPARRPARRPAKRTGEAPTTGESDVIIADPFKN